MHRLITLITLLLLSNLAKADAWNEVEHGYAESNGARIHYATMGSGPLVVIIHGFPDFWYGWRHQALPTALRWSRLTSAAITAATSLTVR